MRNLSGSQIREEFLRFFEGKEHRRVHSSSLVPANDPTLLFTNAGMNQFKDVFLGQEQRNYSRAASSQKCVRAGGKHNDLENVGFTRRHHTFFEMLGNFSFGDYFKREAIAYAWELLTSPDWFGIPQDRLYVTIFKGENGVERDDEAERLWIEAGVPKERIFEMGMKDNFWQMGDTGPCGPCSEIFFDLGLEAAEVPGVDKPFPQDDQRYMEIWNLVFMQFDRSSDGVLTPLPKPSIDTGMGLERVAAVLQGKLSNYESDLFTPLLKRAAELTGFGGADSSRSGGERSRVLTRDAHLSNDETVAKMGHPVPAGTAGVGTGLSIEELAVSDVKGAASLRIIADHARASTFLISDGVTPANEGRGYVLRKILRRGIRHGRLLGQEKPFMHEMVLAVRDEMVAAYPELAESAERVAKVVLAEEEQFARVLASALARLDEQLGALVERKNLFEEFVKAEHAFEFGPHAQPGQDRIEEEFEALCRLNGIYEDIEEKYQPEFNGEYWGDEGRTNHILREPVVYLGKDAFNLYETFGLPLDFIEDAVRDAGLAFDLDGFERAKEEEQA